MEKKAVICGILATMLIIGGCDNKEDKEWSDDITQTNNQAHGNNMLFWYMYNRSFFGNNYYTPVYHSGSRPFSGNVYSRAGVSMGSMRGVVPIGSVRGASIGSSSFGG